MNELLPKISIITPSLNQGRFIEQTILSVLDQDYPNIEYIIIDGGSTDHTIEILKKYEPHLKYWTSERDNGQAEAINKGWAMASGDIISWINADDIFCPGAFSHVAKAFHDNPDALGFIGGGASYDSTLCRQILYKRPVLDPMKMIETCGSVPIQPSVFLKRQVFEEAGPLKGDLQYVLDWEYWIRVGLLYPSKRFVMLNSMLAINREWEQTKTNTGAAKICREHREVLDMLFRENPSNASFQSIKGAAYRSSYRKQAALAMKEGNTREALRNIFTAWKIRPFGHNPLREIMLLLYAVIGSERESRWRRKMYFLYNKLNSFIGY